MHRIGTMLKVAGLWPGLMLIVIAAYFFVFQPMPFFDMSGKFALAAIARIFHACTGAAEEAEDSCCLRA